MASTLAARKQADQNDAMGDSIEPSIPSLV
jgi:hypothetical protein